MSSVTTTPGSAAGSRIHWGKAIGAGVLATVVMTIVMLFFKMNLMKMLGSMIVGANASPALLYTVGGLMHFMIGIIYGVIFAVLVGRVIEWNRFIKGTVYGLAIAAIALAAMPVMSAMLGGGGAQNPCRGKSAGAAATNPCAGKQAANPCNPTAAANPCAGKQAANPCNPTAAANPCAGKQAANPCKPTAAANPCAGKQAANPCAAKQAANPCGGGAANPCNPCGGAGGPWSGVISVINHLVYAITLAFAYGKVR